MNSRNKRLNSINLYCKFAACAALFTASSTWAANRVIEEVIVTSQKRAQSLQDVPVSVSSFDSEFMQDISSTDIGELVQYTPNVKFNNSLGYAPVLTIRGFGTPPLGRGLEPSVGLQIDDVFYGRSTYINDINFDLARLEVLRGPQGTLFGKNTIAGVFNFASRDPDFDWSGFISAGLSPYEERRIEVGQSITVIEDKLALRIAGRYRDRDSHVYNTAKDEQNHVRDEAVRLKAKWYINESADLLLNYSKTKQEELGLILQLKKASEKSLTEFRKLDPEAEAQEYNDTLSMDSDTFSDRDTESLNVKLSWDFSSIGHFEALNMTLIAGSSELVSPFAIDGDFSPIDFINFGTEEGKPDYYEQDLIELRFGGSLPAFFSWDKGTDFIAGVFYSETNSGVSVRQVNGAGIAAYTAAGAFVDSPDAGSGIVALVPTDAVVLDDDGNAETLFAFNDIVTKSTAYYMQFDWLVSETVTTVIGLRYGEDKRKGHLVSGNSDTTVIAPVVLGTNPYDVNLSATDYDFTPKLTVTWQPLDELTLFATATTGFKSGGYASAVFNDDNLEFEAEEAKAYEIGMKSKLFDGSLTLNGAIFYTAYDNLQVRSFDGRSIFVKNAATAETKGFEFDFFWLPPVPYLSIGGSGGVVEATYVEYRCAPVAAGSDNTHSDPACNGGEGTTEFQDLSGEPLAYAPKLSSSLYAAYNRPISDTGVELLLGLDAIYQGEHFIDTDNDPNAVQEATTKYNARVGFKAESGLWSLIMNAKNISGAEESVVVLDQPNIAGNYVSAALPDSPSLHLDLRINW